MNNEVTKLIAEVVAFGAAMAPFAYAGAQFAKSVGARADWIPRLAALASGVGFALLFGRPGYDWSVCIAGGVLGALAAMGLFSWSKREWETKAADRATP